VERKLDGRKYLEALLIYLTRTSCSYREGDLKLS
jgi:hypothetical protein